MGFKEFISSNPRKSILTILLIIFAPLPFYNLFMIGFAPPILDILVIPLAFSETGNVQGSPINMSAASILLISFAIFTILAYLIACIIMLIFERFTKNTKTHWILILILSIILVVASFFDIYYVGVFSMNSQSGFGKANILDLLPGNI